jgi:hypothetical protein
MTATKKQAKPAPKEEDRPGIPGTILPIPHHPEITLAGFRDETLKEWLIEYYPDLANLALLGKVTNHTQPSKR